MRTIEVDWPGSHDAGDDEGFVMGFLEAGYDEGPLLVVPCSSGRSPSSQGADRPHMFRDASHYIAHLAMHEGELSGERWVGLVRGGEHESGTAALAALVHLRRAVTPPKRRRHLSRDRHEQPALDYAAYSEEPIFSGELRIVHVGEYAKEVLAAFPGLPQGRVEIGADR